MAKDDILDNLGRGPKIDPVNYPQMKCDKCGHNIFRSGVIIYNIPGIELGIGVDIYPYPIPVYVCDKCGTVIKLQREDLKLDEEVKEEPKKSSLIL